MRHRWTDGPGSTLEVLDDNGVWVSVPSAARDLLRVVSELLGEYVKDEDRYNAGNGEPFGSLSTKTGMLARSAVAQFAVKKLGL